MSLVIRLPSRTDWLRQQTLLESAETTALSNCITSWNVTALDAQLPINAGSRKNGPGLVSPVRQAP